MPSVSKSLPVSNVKRRDGHPAGSSVPEGLFLIRPFQSGVDNAGQTTEFYRLDQ
jgi:hypothetical protein